VVGWGGGWGEGGGGRGWGGLTGGVGRVWCVCVLQSRLFTPARDRLVYLWMIVVGLGVWFCFEVCFVVWLCCLCVVGGRSGGLLRGKEGNFLLDKKSLAKRRELSLGKNRVPDRCTISPIPGRFNEVAPGRKDGDLSPLRQGSALGGKSLGGDGLAPRES